MKQKTRICITGGHLTPALAVIDELKDMHPDWEIVFMGRKHAFAKDNESSQEYKEIKKRNIRFFPIIAGKLRRDISWNTFLALLKFPIGIIQSFWYMARVRPQCILSFGGYVGLPVGFCGWLLGIPVVIHEQTHTLGIANRLLLPLVSRCLVSYKNTKYAPEKTALYTGLPIRREITNPSKTLSFAIPADLPIIYITGGSTGAVSMNELLFPIIHSLVKKTVVIHQTGAHSIDKALQIKQSLTKHDRFRYIPLSYIEGSDVGWIMHHMSLLVGRSGGNTVAETAMVHKPAVFIPLPWSGQNEQEQNARWYEKTGMAYVANQEKDTPMDIQRSITLLLKLKHTSTHATKVDAAAKNIIGYIELLVNDNEK